MNTIKYNEKWAKSVTKKEFIETYKNHPGDIDWSAEYDRINPPKEKAPTKTEAQEPEKGLD
jgi:hypothetical protein